MKNMIIEAIKQANSDWIEICELIWIVKSIGKIHNLDEIKIKVLQLLELLLQQGLMDIGYIEKNNGFIAWETSVEDSLLRVKTEWDKLNREPEIGEIFWLANTEKGHIEAKKYL